MDHLAHAPLGMAEAWREAARPGPVEKSIFDGCRGGAATLDRPIRGADGIIVDGHGAGVFGGGRNWAALALA